MKKKVLILSGSPRKGGNSDLLCDEFMRGAIEAENDVEKIRVAEKKVSFCSACYYCRQSGGVCAKKDDMADILQKMVDADVIVLSSPVYFYSIDAQMKALIDRTLARWTEVKNKKFYYIITCADTDKAAQETTLACFRGYADCVEGARKRVSSGGPECTSPERSKRVLSLCRRMIWERLEGSSGNPYLIFLLRSV